MAKRRLRQRAATFVQLTFVYQLPSGVVYATRSIGNIARDVENWAESNNLYIRTPGTLTIQDNFLETTLDEVNQAGQVNSATGRHDIVVPPMGTPESDVTVTVHKTSVFMIADQMEEEEMYVDYPQQRVEQNPAPVANDESIVLNVDSGVRELGTQDIRRE